MTYIISDLHMGDGGPRDNFYGREDQLNKFLDHVGQERLVIAGDLFELWQSNISAVLTKRMGLLDKLSKMNVTYLLGNHDLDLFFFNSTYLRIDHPFFDKISMETWVQDTLVVHGHEEDPDCKDFDPGLARISAIYTGIKESKNGCPGDVEIRTLKRLDWLRFWKKKVDIVANVEKTRNTENAENIIFGHTHQAGKRGRVWNCGSWSEGRNDYIRIFDSEIKLYHWFNKAIEVKPDAI